MLIKHALRSKSLEIKDPKYLAKICAAIEDILEMNLYPIQLIQHSLD